MVIIYFGNRFCDWSELFDDVFSLAETKVIALADSEKVRCKPDLTLMRQRRIRRASNIFSIVVDPQSCQRLNIINKNAES